MALHHTDLEGKYVGESGRQKADLETGTDFPVYIEAILLGFYGIFVQ